MHSGRDQKKFAHGESPNAFGNCVHMVINIPAVLRTLTGVRYGHHITLHQCQEGHDLLIRGEPADLRGVQGRRMEEGIATMTVVVGTEDESG
jgi:hypothetical protein